MSGIPFPNIDPTLFQIGPFAIRWYALAYVAGLLLGWLYARWLVRANKTELTVPLIDDFLLWALAGVVVGGRLGYVLIYNPDLYFAVPEEIFAVWNGGMSFHGGLIGVIVAVFMFARRRAVAPLALFDIVAAATPIGLFFGRIANFINGELFGRLTELPWGVIFPAGGPIARHPSQLYEALAEGLVLFAVVFVLVRMAAVRAREGFVAGVFLTLYAAARFALEFVREPDNHLGFLAGGLTMGQILTLPMLAVGLYLISRAQRQRA